MKPTPTPEANTVPVRERIERLVRDVQAGAIIGYDGPQEYWSTRMGAEASAEIARLLSATLSVPAAAVVGEPEPIGYCSEYGLDKLASQAHHYCLSVSKAQENEFQFPIYASRISQQDAELERMRREVEEAKEFRAILEGHLAAAIDDYNDALKALEPFARVAEHDIGESEADSDFFMPMKTYNRAPLLTVGDFRNALALRAKAEETGHDA